MNPITKRGLASGLIGIAAALVFIPTSLIFADQIPASMLISFIIISVCFSFASAVITCRDVLFVGTKRRTS